MGEGDVDLYGPGPEGGRQASIIAFNLRGIHGHDLSTIADEKYNVQFRSGHHCAQPAMTRLGIHSCCRISFGVYSDMQDVEALVEAMAHARRIFR